MKILHVVATLAPTSGGPTRGMKGLASAQTSAGHEVTICTTDRGNPVRQKLPKSYFDSFYSDETSLQVFPVTFAPLLYSSSMARWLRTNIRRFDLVHVHGLYRFPTTFAGREARRQGVPFVVAPHGALDPFLYDKSAYSVPLKRLYEYWLDVPVMNGASAIHYTTDEERERASFLRLQPPSFVAPNGVDWDYFEELPPRGALRQRWGLGDAPVVLFLGRLHFKKGLDLLIPAFKRTRTNLPSAQLVIAGPANDKYGSSIKALTRTHGLDAAVNFVGPLHGEDVAQAYVDADVFVLPSYTESFGTTVAEAMAASLPVIISDQVNIHSSVKHAGAGLVTACDAGEVAEAMEVLLTNPERRRSMGRAGRALVETCYRWPVIVEAMTRNYGAAIRGGGQESHG